MFYFDAALAADRQEEYISLSVSTMVVSVVLHDVTLLPPIVLSVSTMVCTPVFYDVKMRVPGGQPFIGGSIGFGIGRPIAHSLTEKWG